MLVADAPSTAEIAAEAGEGTDRPELIPLVSEH